MFKREVKEKLDPSPLPLLRARVADVLTICGHPPDAFAEVSRITTCLMVRATALWADAAVLAYDSEFSFCGALREEAEGGGEGAASSPLHAAVRPLRSLGAGAFGRVWLSDEGGSLVVVKQLSLGDLCAFRQSHAAGREGRLQRLLAGGPTPCPFLVRAHCTDAAPDGSYLYTKLQPLLGGTLLDHLSYSLRSSEGGGGGPAGGLPFAAARYYLAGVLLALLHLHAAGVVHRDVKGDNVVLLTREGGGHPVLVDLGFARSVARPDGDRLHAACARARSVVASDPTLAGRADDIAARLVQAEQSGSVAACCACPCAFSFAAAGAAHARGEASPTLLPHHLHTYHSPGESALHLAACVEAYHAGRRGVSWASHPPPPSPFRSRAESVLGPVHALPPEMSPRSDGAGVQGHDRSADVWCFGVLACELLTGVSPITGAPAGSAWDDEGAGVSSVDLAGRAQRGDLVLSPTLHALWPDASGLVRQCLCVDPTLRPTVEELLGHPAFTAPLSAQGGQCGHAGPGAGASCALCWRGDWAAYRAGRVAPPPLVEGGREGGPPHTLHPPPHAFGHATFLQDGEVGVEEEGHGGHGQGVPAPPPRLAAAPEWDTLEVAIEYAYAA